jgi:glycosyltransferase involved in cell wall biosynthesis
LVIGDGPGRDRLETNARALAPEGSRVRFLGARLDVPAVPGLADLVVVPQLTGGVNVALEAMAAGRPIVAANTTDLAAVLRDRETGVLAPARKPAEMARAMRRLLLDPDLRARVGNAARRHVLDRHAVTRVVPALEAVYQG